jgi:hypothetical protein
MPQKERNNFGIGWDGSGYKYRTRKVTNTGDERLGTDPHRGHRGERIYTGSKAKCKDMDFLDISKYVPRSFLGEKDCSDDDEADEAEDSDGEIERRVRFDPDGAHIDKENRRRRHHGKRAPTLSDFEEFVSSVGSARETIITRNPYSRQVGFMDAVSALRPSLVVPIYKGSTDLPDNDHRQYLIETGQDAIVIGGWHPYVGHNSGGVIPRACY